MASWRSALKQHIRSATHVTELLIILQQIPLDSIKQFMIPKIGELTDESLRKSYYNSLSINEIFSDDLLQCILSFSGCYNEKGVNKKWKSLSDKNESLYLKQLYKTDKIAGIKLMKYDENINKTWIIHQDRKRLHLVEEALGFKGPINDLRTAAMVYKDNDKLLVYGGDYLTDTDDSIHCDHSVQIIGIGHQHDIRLHDSLYIGSRNSEPAPASVHIENIDFIDSIPKRRNRLKT